MRKYYRIILLVVTLLFFCLCLFACGNEGDLTTPNGEQEEKIAPSVTVDILKIGKADCIIINTSRHILMVDTGERENLSQIHAYMQEKGYEQIDTLIISHYDKDHIGGAEEIIKWYGVKTVFESNFTETTTEYTDYHQAIEDTGATLKKLSENARLELDGVTFDILVPQKKKYNTDKDNNTSLIVSMECGEKKLLFCGDALELRMVELVYDEVGHYDFVKLPHHGTYLENYPMVLEELTPAYCAITCSNKNPADEKTLSILSEIGAQVFQTKDGLITISVDDKTITVTQ